MFKLVKALGKLVVKMYFREAAKLDEAAKTFAKDAVYHAKAADKAQQESIKATNEAAKVAANAQKLKGLF